MKESLKLNLIRRQNYFLCKWFKHGGWYPDHVLRFFRKDKGYFGGINPYDAVIIESGNINAVDIPLCAILLRLIWGYEFDNIFDMFVSAVPFSSPMGSHCSII